jgi:hypothetical protein
MVKVILPKFFINGKDDENTLVFFLAGPVLGGGDWQYEAFKEFSKRIHPDVLAYIIIPCRYDALHPFRNGKHSQIAIHWHDECITRQTVWERQYLNRASEPRRGCVLFWLPCESKIEPRNDHNPYARDTYGELGEWRGRLMANPNLSVVVGAEEKFPGLSVISCNFNRALGREFPIYPTLADTVDAAIKKVT